MKIKDIVNRDVVNLTNCEFEAIHIPGSIQPHGFLLAINATTWKIDFCSGNIQDYIAVNHNKILNSTFKDVFGEDQQNRVDDYILKNLLLSSSLLKLHLKGVDFLCTLHKSEGNYILEAEKTTENAKKITDVYEQTSQFLSYMNEAHSLKELCQMVAEGTREVTGYDRVMIYRFDKDYNGEVFAESVRNDLEPFLGLHYPHTDIPLQARELYMKNLLRLIVDIEYKPVPIYTIDDGNETKNLDLSLSILRSTSPMHVQYLSNMGVGATLTISLIHKKKLWGLIACHHYSVKNLTPEIRLASQLQGHFITSQIDVRQSNEEYDVARKSNIALEKLNSYDFPATESYFKFIADTPEILEICNAYGVAIIYNFEIYKGGLTPDDHNINKISLWAAENAKKNTFHTEKLLDYLSDSTEYCSEASGIVYHSLGTDNLNCIIWFRPESLTEVNWAGDPNKAIIKDINGLYPRNSFKLYREIVKCQSKIWLQPELNAAANYAHTLQKQFNLLNITKEEEKYRKLSEVLKETNSELENINWISTHDLQEPLRKIQMISSRILGTESEVISENVFNSMQRMNNSANRMQTLLIDILKYTKIKNVEDSFECINLNKIVEEIYADMQDQLNDKKGKINIENLPETEGMPFLIKQLFSNLIQNSIKYASSERNPIIDIKYLGKTQHDESAQDWFKVIEISDNGIGFEQVFAEKIFKIFSRLHNHTEYVGSGVGLALCKKIMTVHKGFIIANGVPDGGAIFKLYFAEPAT